MKYILISIICLLTLNSCEKHCSHDAAEKLSLWEANKPNYYAYTINRVIFTSQEYLGPYRFEILNDEIDTVYFDLTSYQDPLDQLFEGWDDYEKVLSFVPDSRIEDIFDRILSYDQACEATYDDTYFFPSEHDILSDPEIADSGSIVRITKFEVLD